MGGRGPGQQGAWGWEGWGVGVASALTAGPSTGSAGTWVQSTWWSSRAVLQLFSPSNNSPLHPHPRPRSCSGPTCHIPSPSRHKFKEHTAARGVSQTHTELPAFRLDHFRTDFKGQPGNSDSWTKVIFSRALSGRECSQSLLQCQTHLCPPPFQAGWHSDHSRRC